MFVSGYEGSPLAGLDMALARHPRVSPTGPSTGGAKSDSEGRATDRAPTATASDGEQTPLAPPPPVIHVPAVNEELAATAVWGSQTVPRPDPAYDGVVGYWYGKAPGLDRAGDALRHANYVGAAPNGGAVVIVGDDPGAKSSTLPSASEATLAELCMPVLVPGDSRDLVFLARHAVGLSRFSGLWVGLKIATDVADGLGVATLEIDAASLPVDPDFDRQADGRPWRPTRHLVTLPPDSLESEREVLDQRLRAAEAYAAANHLNRIIGAGPELRDTPGLSGTGADAATPATAARLGIVAAGTVFQAVLQALADLGIGPGDLEARGIRLLKLGMPYPLEAGIVRRFAEGLDTIVVVEEKRPFIETAVKDCLYDLEHRPAVLGKRDRDGRPLVPADGELTPDRVRQALAPVLGAAADGPASGAMPISASGAVPISASGAVALPHRTPFFCSGCPHNRSTIAPDGSVIGAGIGCHTMVQLTDDPRRKGLALTQMGGEGAQWIGQSPFSRAGHAFQNIGDGTFFHSGTLAIRACVAAGVDITYKLLYNRAVAMTGGQDPVGGKDVPEVAHLLTAEGVRRIIVCSEEPERFPDDTVWPEGTTVWTRDRLDEAQRRLQSEPGVTVLIYDQQCAAEARRLRKRGLQAPRPTRIFINTAVCEGCGDCGVKSNCLSLHPVDTPYGRKTQVHQSSCNQDYTCVEGDCPSFVTVEPRHPSHRRGGKRRRTNPSRALASSPRSTASSSGTTDGTPAWRAVLDEHLPDPTDRAGLDHDGEYTFYLTGIGGTGIVTVNQVMAAAAGLDGLEVTGLDQTGLSQKAGPVVSHLKISHSDIHSSRRLSQGRADCFLAFDLLVAAEPKNLAMGRPGRTVAVASLSETPTGSMIGHPTAPPAPTAELQRVLDAVTTPERNRYLDSLGLAHDLFGDEVAANILLVGAAYQAGAIPISAESIEKAIETNGVAVALNRAAFRWGRLTVLDPSRVESARPGRIAASGPGAAGRNASRDGAAGSKRPGPGAAAGGTTAPRADAAASMAAEMVGRSSTVVSADVVEPRVADLIRYQDRRLAARYLDFLEEVLRAEQQSRPASTELTETVARGLFKLMAYKDEYEVARLYLSDDFSDALISEFPDGVRLRYRLHPPVLRSLGKREKSSFGPWFRYVFLALYRLRFLRGSPLDPFGHTQIRRTERRLVKEYTGLVRRALSGLDSAPTAGGASPRDARSEGSGDGSFDRARQLAALPDVVRGYEEIKLAGVERFRTEAAALVQEEPSSLAR